MDGWIEQCQLILKATHGMDYYEFVSFLKTISERRLRFLQGEIIIVYSV